MSDDLGRALYDIGQMLRSLSNSMNLAIIESGVELGRAEHSLPPIAYAVDCAATYFEDASESPVESLWANLDAIVGRRVGFDGVEGLSYAAANLDYKRIPEALKYLGRAIATRAGQQRTPEDDEALRPLYGLEAFLDSVQRMRLYFAGENST